MKQMNLYNRNEGKIIQQAALDYFLNSQPQPKAELAEQQSFCLTAKALGENALTTNAELAEWSIAAAC
ncbi:MAG: hypothetical protein V1776_04775 [Candidatus Diapherotrites archaeon]